MNEEKEEDKENNMRMWRKNMEVEISSKGIFLFYRVRCVLQNIVEPQNGLPLCRLGPGTVRAQGDRLIPFRD